MSSGGTATVAVSVPDPDRAAAISAAAAFRRFYPEVQIELHHSCARLCSSDMSEQQLRTAWLCHFHEAKTHAFSVQAREALLQKLFA